MEKAPVCNCNVIHEDVVAAVQKQLHSHDEYIQLAGLFKLFGDSTRLKIVHALELHEMCVCDLAAILGVTKSAVSHQLKALRLAKLVSFRREGQIVYYFLNDDHVKALVDLGWDHLADTKEE